MPPPSARLRVALGAGAVLGATALAWLAVGPLGVAVLVAVALLPRLRPRWAALRPHRPWRASVVTVLALGLVVGGLAVLPDRWVPALPGPGLLVTPSYDGRPALAQPLAGPALSPGRLDLPVDRPGPVGDLPRATTAALGRPGRDCAPVAADLRPPVLLCAGAGGRHDLALLDLAAGPDPVGWAGLAGSGGCAPVAAAASPTTLVVGDGARLLPVRVDGRRLVVGRPARLGAGTAPGSGAGPDCAVEVRVGPDGVTWVRTRAGRLVRVPPGAARARARTDLRPRDADPGAGAASGGGLVVTGTVVVAAHDGRVTAVAATGGAVAVRWRRDLGAVLGPPALVDQRWVVVGVEDGPRAEVVALDADSGEVVCRAPVFEDGAGRVRDRPVALPGAALLRNDHDDAAAGDGLALLRLPGCVVAWTGGEPARAPLTVSAATGLAYAVQRVWTPWLVPVTRLAAVDPRTGRQSFTTRAATGLLGAPAGPAPALGPEGAAYVVVHGGLVQLRDRLRAGYGQAHSGVINSTT